MESIKDKIAVVGMGCSKFGERWDTSAADLIIEAAYEAFEDVGIGSKDIQAAWVGTNTSGVSGACLANPLKLSVPITRVENYCCTGMDAFRNACFGVASGMYDVVLALGFEKLKDTGTSGLTGQAGASVFHAPTTQTVQVSTPASLFGLAGARYFEKFGATRETLAKIAVKNHHNGTMAPKAHFQREITLEQALNAPMVSWPLALYDCCGVTDGAAAAIITRKEMAKSFRSDYALVKGLGCGVDPSPHMWRPGFDYLGWPATVEAGRQAYEQARIKDPFKELDMAEVHDCFTLTELLICEDLGFCRKGEGKQFVDDGVFTMEGDLPVNTDGGLKAFGHPVGASGIRMIYEVYKQLQGKAERRQLKNVDMGLAMNLGGWPQVATVTILGR